MTNTCRDEVCHHDCSEEDRDAWMCRDDCMDKCGACELSGANMNVREIFSNVTAQLPICLCIMHELS